MWTSPLQWDNKNSQKEFWFDHQKSLIRLLVSHHQQLLIPIICTICLIIFNNQGIMCHIYMSYITYDTYVISELVHNDWYTKCDPSTRCHSPVPRWMVLILLWFNTLQEENFHWNLKFDNSVMSNSLNLIPLIITFLEISQW